MEESGSYTLHCCLLFANERIAYLLGSICPWVQKYGQNVETNVKFKNIRLMIIKWSTIRSDMSSCKVTKTELVCMELLHSYVRKMIHKD